MRVTDKAAPGRGGGRPTLKTSAKEQSLGNRGRREEDCNDITGCRQGGDIVHEKETLFISNPTKEKKIRDCETSLPRNER